ncbi:MAG: hypothetical protein J6A04_01255 [Clostridia bacterium]|nr:hypothetical protein [Clostridia bacterium]
MKSFYGGTYIGREILEENGIYHPIRLEYYKIENEESNKLFYGIEVVKTEYKETVPKVEKNEVKNITMNETEIIEILEKFKRGTVMPDFLEEMVEEQFQSTKKLCC